MNTWAHDLGGMSWLELLDWSIVAVIAIGCSGVFGYAGIEALRIHWNARKERRAMRLRNYRVGTDCMAGRR